MKMQLAAPIFSSAAPGFPRLALPVLALLVTGAITTQAQTAPQDPSSQPAAAAPEAAAEIEAHSFEVSGDVLWFDTELDLHAGDQVHFTGSGMLTLANGSTVGPDGAKRGWRDLMRSYPVNAAGQGALIGRIGDNQTSPAFLIAASADQAVRRDGRLFLGLNKSGPDNLQGIFTVQVELRRAAPDPVSEQPSYQLPKVTLAMIDQIPRRVVDADGNEGDNNNFVIVGPEAAVVDALQSVGWVQVDRSNSETVVNGILAVLNKEAYLTIPMSELMMFGRVQDYGFAHAEPIAVVAQRHHFRLWKAPFTAGGREIWVGAGTHDIGFDRDQRNNGITHKIDPEVDNERDYIGQSLEESGMVASKEYIMPSVPNKEALTATGGSFFSDGRVLVIHLKPQAGENFEASQEGEATDPAIPFRSTTGSDTANPGRGRTDGRDSTAEAAPDMESLEDSIFQGLFEP